MSRAEGRRPTVPRPHGAESGVATVLGIGLAGLLVVLALAAATVVAILDAHRRAESAADLAALAGGGALADGRDPCGVAADIAHRNGARLSTCRAGTGSVAVSVTVQGPGLWGMAPPLGARARAGPVTPPGWGPRSPTARSWR